jgi:hypothetical protein
MIPDVHGDNGSGVILAGDHMDPVLECTLVELKRWDVQLRARSEREGETKQRNSER